MSDALYWTAAYSASYPNFNWRSPIAFPDHYSADRPALAVFQGKLRCVHRGSAGDESLWQTSFDFNDGWSKDTLIPGQGSSAGPALAVYGGKLYCVYIGNGSDQTLYCTSTSDGENWSDRVTMKSGISSNIQSSAESPSLTVSYNGPVHQNQLFCVYRGGGDNPNLYCTTSSDGQRIWGWPYIITDPSTNARATSTQGPALVRSNDSLSCLYRGGTTSDAEIHAASYNDQNWVVPPPDSGLTTSGAPAAVNLSDIGGSFLCVFRGAGTDTQLRWAYNTDDGWSSPATLPGCASDTGVGLAEVSYTDPTGATAGIIFCVFRKAG